MQIQIANVEFAVVTFTLRENVNLKWCYSEFLKQILGC